MLTVMEMLAHPSFSDFHLISDRSGLNNRIRNTNILDWVSEDSLDESFSPGDFVVTTLAAYRNDPELADSVFEALIEKNISGIAIKDTYCTKVSEHILDKANEHHIPVFLFSNPGTAELVHALKNESSFIEINQAATKTMRKLLYEAKDDAQTDILVREINPFFSNNVICAFGMPRSFQHKEEILNRTASSYRDYLSAIRIDPEVSYTVVFFSIGVCIIYTDQRENRELKKDLLALIRQFSIDLDQFAVGFSDQMNSLSETDKAVKEAIYAAADAHINKESVKTYSSMGFTKVLCPLRGDYWMKNYYEDLLNMISEYDEKHDAHLFETISDYIHCNGDINATAQASYQHPNTIRYRIKKAQELLNAENNMDFRIQLYTIVRLHEINELLADWRL